LTVLTPNLAISQVQGQNHSNKNTTTANASAIGKAKAMNGNLHVAATLKISLKLNFGKRHQMICMIDDFCV
jgi:hypothetical protein